MQIHFEQNLLFYAFEEKFRREENNLRALIYSGKVLEFVKETQTLRLQRCLKSNSSHTTFDIVAQLEILGSCQQITWLCRILAKNVIPYNQVLKIGT